MITAIFEPKTGNPIHTDGSDLNIVIESLIEGTPEIRFLQKEVPGRDGLLDYTDFFGEPTYSNRPLTFKCGCKVSSRSSFESNLRNAIHGQQCKIIVSTDPDHYYTGRVAIGDFEYTVGIAHFEIACDCHPWKNKREKTIITHQLTAKRSTITLENERRKVIPEINVTDETTVEKGDKMVTLSPGTHVIPEFALTAGANTFYARGPGTITFTYQEATM